MTVCSLTNLYCVEQWMMEDGLSTTDRMASEYYKTVFGAWRLRHSSSKYSTVTFLGLKLSNVVERTVLVE
jgi:hypothetical protein